MRLAAKQIIHTVVGEFFLQLPSEFSWPPPLEKLSQRLSSLLFVEISLLVYFDRTTTEELFAGFNLFEFIPFILSGFLSPAVGIHLLLPEVVLLNFMYWKWNGCLAWSQMNGE